MAGLTKAQLNELAHDLIEQQEENAHHQLTFTGDAAAAVSHANAILEFIGDGSELCPHTLAHELRSLGYALQVAGMAADIAHMGAVEMADAVDEH